MIWIHLPYFTHSHTHSLEYIMIWMSRSISFSLHQVTLAQKWSSVAAYKCLINWWLFLVYYGPLSRIPIASCVCLDGLLNFIAPMSLIHGCWMTQYIIFNEVFELVCWFNLIHQLHSHTFDALHVIWIKKCKTIVCDLVPLISNWRY